MPKLSEPHAARQRRQPIQVRWVACVVAVAAMVSAMLQPVAADGDNHEERGFYVWPMPARVVLCVVTILLSAMFCGLTIGLLGVDTVTLEIIASAGAEPDRTYAEKILPIRHLGHQLLASLLLGNMLTLVLTSQLVAAIVQSTELVNFITATLTVLILGEILPMAYCNKGSNGLKAGVKSLPVLKVALLVLYPIAKPLGMLLDCIISHDAGQLYDKNEIKKLIRVHYEKHAEKSGINQDELRMMLSALEMNEITVSTAMTPLDHTFMLDASLPLDAALLLRLWELGKSRVPVYSRTKSNIIGVLYVKDLINVSTLRGDELVTIREFIVGHPRDLLVISERALLQDGLKIFESHYTQLLFVEKAVPGQRRGFTPLAACGSPSVDNFAAATDAAECHASQTSYAPFSVSKPRLQQQHQQRNAEQERWEGDTTNTTLEQSDGVAAHSSSRHYRTAAARGEGSTGHVRPRQPSGEEEREREDDVMDGSVRLRENSGTDRSAKSSRWGSVSAQARGPLSVPETITPRALLEESSTEHRVFLGVVTLEDIIERLIASEIYDEDEYNMVSDDASTDTNSDAENEILQRSAKRSFSLQHQPVRAPRVNFYSYALTQGAMEENDDLSEEQKWALASYLTRAYVFFARWTVPKIKFLLDEVGDRRVFVSAEAAQAYEAHLQAARAQGLPLPPSATVATAAAAAISLTAELLASTLARKAYLAATAHARPPMSTAEVDVSRLLYTAGEPSHAFTLILSGGVDVVIGPEKFRTELRSFSSLGEEIFASADEFVPDYTAIVSRTSRLIVVSHEDVYRVERKINAVRRQRKRRPVKLTTFDGKSSPAPELDGTVVIAEQSRDGRRGHAFSLAASPLEVVVEASDNPGSPDSASTAPAVSGPGRGVTPAVDMGQEDRRACD